MNIRTNSTISKRRAALRPVICTASIAAFMAAGGFSSGDTFTVNLGDNLTVGTAVVGPLVKNGLGTLNLTGAQAFAGGTTIDAGAIVITGLGSIGTGAITVNGSTVQGSSSGQLVLGGSLTPASTVYDFASIGGLVANGGGPGGNGFGIVSVGNNTIAGVTGGLVGQLRIASTYGFATLSAASALTVGAGGVQLSGNGHWTAQAGSIVGAGLLQKAGAGTLVLQGAQTFTGVLQPAGGFIRVSDNANLGLSTAAASIDWNNGALEVRTDAPNFGTRTMGLATNSGTINIDRAVTSPANSLAINQTVAFGNLALANAARTLTINSRNGYNASFVGLAGTIGGGGAGNMTFTNAGSGTLSLLANVWNDNDTTIRTLLFNGVADHLVTGNILAGTQANHVVAKAGAGTLTLQGTASTFRGTMDIQQGMVIVNQIAGGLGNVASTTAVNLGNAATTGILTYLGAAGTGAGETTTRAFNLNGSTGGGRIFANQSGSSPSALILAGTLNNTTAGAKNLLLGGTSASSIVNEIQGVLANNVSTQAASLTKVDGNTWALSGVNTYTGATTIAGGTLQLKANAAASTILDDTSAITFNADALQAAHGTLEFVGQAATNNVEALGALVPTQGLGTVKLTPGSGGGTASVSFASLGGVASLGASVNLVTPDPLTSKVTITGQADGFIRGNIYLNGNHFAIATGGTGLVAAPVYGTTPGFVTSAAALTASAHNEVTGAGFTLAAGTTAVNSLRIDGSSTPTLTMAAAGDRLVINNGLATVGGILLVNGSATITGGAVTQGLGSTLQGGGALVVRVEGGANTLTLASPLTNSTTGGLSKNGAGTLILSGNNAQTGTTNLDEGTIKLATGGRLSGNSALTIRQGATFDLNAVATGTAINGLNGPGLITNTGSAAAALTVGNNNGAGTFTGIIQNGTNQVSVIKQGQGGQTMYGLNTYTGSTTINSTGNITVTNLTNIGSASGIGVGDATSDATNAASLVFGGTTGALNYVGAKTISVDRLFTFAGTGGGAGGRLLSNPVIDPLLNNTVNNGVGLVFNKTNTIAYTAAASTVAQTLTLGGASVADNQINLQLTNPGGVASAVLNVTKADAGLWVLGNTSNSYTGTTSITAGILVANSGASLPTASPLLLNGGGVLQTSGSFTRPVAASSIPGAGEVAWVNNGGGGGFSASDAKLTVNLGPGSALTWGSGGFLPSSSTQALVLSSTTALFDTEVVNAIDLGTANRTVTVNDNGTTSLDFATLSGVISGSTAGIGLQKNGTGLLNLTGANTYTGSSTATAGILQVTSIGNTASTSSNLGAGGGSLVLNGAAVWYVGGGESSNRPVELAAGTTLDSSGYGPLGLSALAQTTNAAIAGSTNAKTLTLTGINTDKNTISSVLGNAALNSTAALSVTKAGAGTWILSGANTYTGNTSPSAGNLGAGSNTAFGTGILVFGNGNVFADGGDRTLANNMTAPNITSGIIGVNSLTMTGSAAVGVGGNWNINNNLIVGKVFEIQGQIVNGEAATARDITLGGTGKTVFSGPVADGLGTTASPLGITNNNGTLMIGASSANTYSRNTTLAGGTIQLAGTSGDAIPNGVGKGNFAFTNVALPATLDVNGRTETINALTVAGSGAKTIDNTSASAAALTVGDNGGAVSFSGTISNTGGGPLSIAKVGTGAGVLNGSTITYSGTTTVSGGSLSFPNATPTATTGVTVAGGAALSLQNATGAGLSALTSLSLGVGAGTAALALDLGPTSDTLTTSGAATTANTIAFAINGLPGFGPGTYNLLVAPGGGLLGPTYLLTTLPGGNSYTINQSATLISLTATALAAQTVFFTGDLSPSWSAVNAGNTNWADSAGTNITSTPGPLDTVVFSSTIVQPVNSTATGNVVLSTLDGNRTIDNLQFNGSAATGTAVVHIAQGTGAGVLTIAPSSSADGISLPDNSGTASIGAPVQLGTDQTWTVGSTGSPAPLLTISGVLSGTGNVTKSGFGTVNLSNNASTRTGKTAINQGVLGITSEASLGANPLAPTADALTVNAGTLRFNAATNIDDPNRGIIVNAGTFDAATGNSTISNVIAGIGGITKVGAQTLILNAVNTYTGGTTITAGVLRPNSAAAIPGAAVTLDGTGATLELPDGLSLPHTITIADLTAGGANSNQKVLRLLAGATTGTFPGPINITESSGGNFAVNASAGGTLTVSGLITQGGTLTSAAGILKNGAGTVIVTNPGNTMRGPITVNLGILQPSVNGALSSGAVTVNATTAGAATLDLNNTNLTVSSLTFGGTGGLAGSVNTLQTGLTGLLTLNGNVATNATGNPTTPATLTGNVVTGASRTFTVADSTGSATDLLVNAVISASTTGVGITKAGTGVMVLAAANTYTGTTTVTGGILRNGVNNAVPAGGNVAVNAIITGTTASYELNGTTQSVGTLTFGGTSTVTGAVNSVTTGAGTLTLNGNVTTNAPAVGNLQALLTGNVAMAGTRTFTVADVAAQNTDLLVTAAVSGVAPADGLIKAGLGTMELSGTSTYTGPTTINAGILRVSGSISGSTVTVNAGGTLGGVGATGGVVLSGGTIAPGASIGTLTTGPLTLNGTSKFELEINTTNLTSDKAIVGGNLTLDNANTVVLTLADLGANAVLNMNDKFTFITYSGTWNGGLFSYLGSPVADEGTLLFGANSYRLDYNDGGNSVSLIAVPEPGIAASLLGGFGMLVGLQRIRRRSDRRA